jgi:steroid 5-alpha reductase family enzyme
MKSALTSIVMAALVLALGWAAGQGGPRLGPAPLLTVLAALAIAVQWTAFVPAALLRSERFYDLTGSLTYLSVVGLAFTLSPNQGLREVVLTAMVAVWAVRLGTFLFRRVRADGKDGRFDAIKTNPGRFLVAWTLQGVWVFLTAFAGLVAITSPTAVAVGPLDAVGWGLWALGFGLEATADAQKSRFRKDPANEGRWIESGLWGWSRHPNYLGEILLWTGVSLSAASTMRGWTWLGLVSPLFVFGLLARGSGVPLLEERADARWGGDPDYEAYKERVPVLVPGAPWLR